MLPTPPAVARTLHRPRFSGFLVFALCLTLLHLAVHAQQPQAASISGTVTDEDGDAVEEAHITLTTAAASTPRETLSDAQGHFTFAALAAQTYTITINAEGFGAASSTVSLQLAQQFQEPTVILHAATEQHVEAVTQEQLAEQQVKQEETQRLAGAIPNFFVTYNWHAQPLTSRQKFELAYKTTVDPVNLAINAGIAGVEQAENSLSGYGSGPAGYGKRYGAATGDLIIGTMAGGYVFPVLFHQDPRYFYKGTGSVMSRALYALSTAVICRGDNGKWQPNYSGVLGDLTAGAASNLYYPATDRNGAALTFENGFLSAAYDGVGNLVQEFIFRKITPGTHKTPPPPP